MLNLCSTSTLNKLPLTRSLIPIKIHFFLILLKKPLLVPRMPSREYSSCQLRCIGSFFLTLCWLFAQISSFEKLVWDNSLDLTWIWYVNFLTAGQFFQQVYLFLDKLGRWVGCCQLWVDWLLFTRSFLPMYELNNSKGIEITHWNYILVMHVNR